MFYPLTYDQFLLNLNEHILTILFLLLKLVSFSLTAGLAMILNKIETKKAILNLN